MSQLTKNQKPLLIILLSVLAVFAFSRLVAYLALEKHFLPNSIFLTINGFRLHHFVYGNILLVLTSFAAIGLNARVNRNWLALFYGIGLGLVLDELPLWLGDVHQLQSYVVIIPYAPIAILVTSAILVCLILRRN